MNQSVNLSEALLATKLNPPATTPSQVTRTSVCDLVRTSQSVKLIVVRAPAGFGKTTAMVQVRTQMEASGIDTAWMTLDSADNDASRFLSCLAIAVSNLTEGQSTNVGEDARGPAFSLGDIALNIMDRLAAHTSPFALFLDDFERLQEPTVLLLVREIIDNLPRQGQLIIGSRSLPDLGLGRLRARGQLLEIDTTRLRFSIDETVEFLTKKRLLALPDEDISQLYRKTEGWIAALWLASVALERREGRSEFISRFSGSNQAIAAYLAEDVLASQPDYIRNFLLRSSILRHISAPLCNALLPGTDSATILGELESANLFLIPIEGEEKTYRYHSLFAEFLRPLLARELPDELPRLHRAASQWYESQGRPVPAIDHALDCGDYEHALSMLSKNAENLLEEGRMRLLARWFTTIPESLLGDSALLQTVHVWAVCFTRGPWEAMTLLERSGCANTNDPEVLAHVLALRPLLLAMMDRNEEAYAIGREALARLPVAKPFADSVLANEMAYIFAVMGHYQESHKLLDAARRYQGESTSAFNRMYSESVEGIIALEEGQLRQATARFRMAVSATHTLSYSYAGGNAWAGVLYAGSLYELNELEQADHLLHVYVPLAKDVGLADHMIIGYVMLSRIAFYRGDVDQALHSLTELEYLGHQRQLPRVVASAKLERARTLLMQGNPQAAKAELERANIPDVWGKVRHLRLPAHDLEYFELSQLRWDIFFGNVTDALPRLESEIAAALDTMRHRRTLKLRILQSVAFEKTGDQRAALATLSGVLKLACPEGFIRLIVDEGEGAGILVRRLSDAMREDGSDRRDPIFMEYLQRILQGFGPALITETDITMSAGQNVLVEPLTSKEIRILLLLADGYSNIALAEKLFVSDSTVRTHLRSINAKLNAKSRTHAVAIARHLGIIH